MTFAQRGCALGNAAACNDFAMALDHGAPFPQDLAAAARLYRDACRDGDAKACANLGSALEHGRGVARDEGGALVLLGDACTGGVRTGCNHLEKRLGERWFDEPGVLEVIGQRRRCEAGALSACDEAARSDLSCVPICDVDGAGRLLARTCRGGVVASCTAMFERKAWRRLACTLGDLGACLSGAHGTSHPR